MIKLLRVDHRLLHGQVAFSWTRAVEADCILIANDSVIKDEIWKTTLKLAKPQGVKLVIKGIDDSIDSINSGVTDKYNLLIIVQNIEDARKLAENCPQVKSINLGGVINKGETKQLGKAVYVTDEELKIFKELVGKGIEIEIRQLPTESKIYLQDVLYRGKKI
ncbi:MAG: PTS sugar transporter subunit IIB [Tissierellia bacterium]|nr:PTS sugar transporter subunit IIB [Tissierellia bacterium]